MKIMTKKRNTEKEKENPIELENIIKDIKEFKDTLLLKYHLSYSRSKTIESLQKTIDLISKRKMRINGEIIGIKEKKLTMKQRIKIIEKEIGGIKENLKRLEVDNNMKQQQINPSSSQQQVFSSFQNEPLSLKLSPSLNLKIEHSQPSLFFSLWET